MASEITTKLGLNKWSQTDRLYTQEFNDNFQKIDEHAAQVTEQLAETNQKTEKVSNSHRSTIIYDSANTVRVVGKSFQMLGFRFMGQYAKNQAPFGEVNQFTNVVSAISDLGCETTKSLSNWYAVFAVLDTDGIVRFKLMPFFRVSSIAGNVITLGEGGENSLASTPRTYSFTSENNLVGSDVLVINEKLGTKTNAFSGRETTVIANNNGTITLANVGTMAVGDYFLVSPPGFENYRYLGSFYIDTAEVRNIADDGQAVKTRGSRVTGISIDGVLTDLYINFGGHISPLASAVYLYVEQTQSNTAIGSYYVYFGLDNAHDYFSISKNKPSTATESVFDYSPNLPFGYRGQTLNLRTAGAIDDNATRALHVRGWVEM